MSRFSMLLILGCASIVAPQIVVGEPLRMAVISDIHTMSPALLVSEGVAFESYLERDRKMLRESLILLSELTDRLIEESPDVVLVSGDLTKDGEMVSHKAVNRYCFERLRDAGIRLFVTAGNHDVANPDAMEYDGEHRRAVRSISASEFAELYAECGYGANSVRDPHSLSYMADITADLRLLVIDSNRYEDNEALGESVIAGRIKEESFDFIESQLERAKCDGVRVVAMMHHGAVEHWKYQNEMVPGYIVDESERLVKMLAKYDVRVIFTGHSHAQDISSSRGVYDIQTGSLVSYPSVYRVVTLDDEGMRVESRSIGLDGLDVDSISRRITREGVLYHILEILPEDMPEDMRDRVAECVADAFMVNYRGDERLTREALEEIRALRREVRGYSFKWSIIISRVTKALYRDPAPADNEFELKF